jgi:hypothetical protein
MPSIRDAAPGSWIASGSTEYLPSSESDAARFSRRLCASKVSRAFPATPTIMMPCGLIRAVLNLEIRGYSGRLVERASLMGWGAQVFWGAF